MKYLMLSLLFVLPAAANAQTVNGSVDAAFAVGKWKESHEGVSLFCVHVTTQEGVKRRQQRSVFLDGSAGQCKGFCHCVHEYVRRHKLGRTYPHSCHRILRRQEWRPNQQIEPWRGQVCISLGSRLRDPSDDKVCRAEQW